MADEPVDAGNVIASPAAVIEPPAGMGIPIDTPASAPVDKKVDDKGVAPPAEPSKVKLPSSIKPPTKTGRFQQRISDLVGQRDSAITEASQLRERLSKMTTVPKAGGGEKIADKPAVNGDVLNPEDFPTYGEYITALVSKTMDQREEASRSRQANAAYENHKEERMAAFNEQAAPLAQEYDGFWDAITDPTLPISEAMADAVLELDELGPYTMLYLAAHKDESAKVARMNPRAATIAIGRLAMRLAMELQQGGEGAPADQGGGVDTQPTPPARVPQAPKPSSVPVPRGSVPALNNEPNDKDDVDTWLRKETDRLRRINPNGRFYGAR